MQRKYVKIVLTLLSCFLFVMFFAISCGENEPSPGGGTTTGGEDEIQKVSSADVLPGTFTVVDSEKGTTRQIQFSKGALYWDGSSFNMEENQYDFRTWSGKESVINGVEITNGTPSGHTGLFYWSKDVEKTYALYYDGTGSTTTDKFALAEGGAIEGWDVLSNEEWAYLINRKDNNENYKYGLATITTEQGASVKGFVLLPDNWTLLSGCTWTAGSERWWITNEYNSTQWTKMEQAGAVFLPAAGIRCDGYSVKDVGGLGNWWSSTPTGRFSGAYYLDFVPNYVNVKYNPGNDGYGVRLVVRGNEVGPHTHTYSSKWTTDEKHHWHAATCGHTDEVSDKAEHSFANGKCSVCGYAQPESKPDKLSGVFSVNTQKKVQFSKGALYWDGTAFKMEENQYDFRTWAGNDSVINGKKTTNGTPTGHTGLFYWSKDVEKTYALNYDSPESAFDTFALANGGAIEGWDVLRKEEWDYLVFFRKDSNNNYKYGLATITTEQGASIHGLVLLPDSWTLPDGCTWTAEYAKGWITNQYNATQWKRMEYGGAVFLPAAGAREGSSVVYGYGDLSSIGLWWASTPVSSISDSAYYLYFHSGDFSLSSCFRSNGYGVRLVAPVSN